MSCHRHWGAHFGVFLSPSRTLTAPGFPSPSPPNLACRGVRVSIITLVFQKTSLAGDCISVWISWKPCLISRLSVVMDGAWCSLTSHTGRWWPSFCSCSHSPCNRKECGCHSHHQPCNHLPPAPRASGQESAPNKANHFRHLDISFPCKYLEY